MEGEEEVKVYFTPVWDVENGGIKGLKNKKVTWDSLVKERARLSEFKVKNFYKVLQFKVKNFELFPARGARGRQRRRGLNWIPRSK